MGRPTAHTAHRHPTAREWDIPHSRAHGYISRLERRRCTFSALGSTPASDPPGLGRSQVFLDRAHPASETDFALHDSGAPEPSFDRALSAVLDTDISETRALPSLPSTGRSRPSSTPTSPRLGRSRAFLRPGAPGRPRHRHLRDSGAPEPSFDRALPAVLDTDISETRALPTLSLSRRHGPGVPSHRQIKSRRRRLANAKPVRPTRPRRPGL
ncbi:hypothetical protein PUN28_003621 [Cardiocondyla obscurior]|uniref:Uncharacterized protein n=1 Tax=Cardiocondyla obscurior TaxID=286306 RepID=A0AAW2GNZ2_9HYME